MSILDPSPARRRYVIAAAVLLVLAPVGFSLAAFVVTPAPGPLLENPVGEDACLAPKTYMRFHHMDYLKELRDAGVRGGERREVSFLTCIACHTERATFCDRCHDAVSLSPDCFGCHYYP